MTNLAPRERALELLGRMTPAEKVAQLAGVLPQPLGAPRNITREKLDEHLGQGIGHICGVGTSMATPDGIAAMTNDIQAYLRDHTRLGIPAIVHNESLNGLSADGFTSFPTAIGLAGTWNPGRVREMADLIRRQMRAVGAHQGLAPVLDVSRDARWGRTHETYGEDVLLASSFGVAYVSGLQGDDLTEGVVATAKHFLGYASTEGGQNMAATHLGARELRDVHAAPFEAAIRLAGLESVMNSYSEIDGAPVALSREILTDLLRGDLGFDGTVVSDYRSLFYALRRQNLGDVDAITDAALAAGLDLELPAPQAYGPELVTRLERGEVNVEDVDRAVLRTLTHKFALGLFENPFAQGEPERIRALAASGKDLSRDLAADSITLLQNDGCLPLSGETASIAVIGPHADSVMAGFANYTHPPFLETLRGMMSGKSRLAGMEQALANPDPEAQAKMRAQMEALAALDPEKVAREQHGAPSLAGALADEFPNARVVTAPGTGVLDDEAHDIPAAIEVARGADVVVIALGGRSAAFAGRATEGEGSDSATMALPSRQIELLEAAVALGKPLVAVVYMGKPYDLRRISDLASAVVTGYIPGPEGGPALAAVIAGSAVPAGKLPFTVPRHVGQTPIYHAQKTGSGQRRTSADQFTGYVDLENTPLLPFGHGLSYGELALSDLALTREGDAIVVEARAANVGAHEVREVVQAYVSAPAGLVTRPERQLAAFGRVDLAPGEAATVRFEIHLDQLGYTGLDGRFGVDPGSYRVRVGLSSEDLPLDGSIDVAGPRRIVEAPHAQLPRATVTR